MVAISATVHPAMASRVTPAALMDASGTANTRTIPTFTISRSQNRFLKNRTSTPTTTATSAST